MKTKLFTFLVLTFTFNIVIAQSGWFSQTSGTSIYPLNSVHFIDNNTGWTVGGYKFDGIILKTTNGGTNWTSQTSGSNVLFSVHFVDNNTGWTVGFYGRILKTTNGGTNWISQQSGLSDTTNLISVHFIDNNTGWTVGGDGFIRDGFNNTILKTTNGGTNWISQKSPTSVVFLHSVRFIDNNTGWIVGFGTTILKTTNGGTNWMIQSGGGGLSGILYSVYFIDNNTGWTVGYPGTILKTTNGGTNWISQTSGISGYLVSVRFIDNNTGWTVGGGSFNPGTILKTTNGGTNWISQTSGISNFLNSVHFIDNNTGWTVGSSGTILKTTSGGVITGVQTISSEIPTQFMLSQNYPNPFNPSTVISYQLSVSSFTSLKVFDLLGNEVSTLVKEKQNAGTYSIEWDGSNFSSGIYFYRLETDGFIQTKRMILMK